jgi:hypothetical protein
MKGTKYFYSLLLVVIAGCASAFMAGSKPHSGDLLGNMVDTYKIPKCTSTTDGSVIDGPKDSTYHLVQTETGPVLYELDKNGEGAAITNYWKDENGMNFLTYVKTSHGWHYIVPDDKSRPAVREVYVAHTYRVRNLDGILKVTSGTPAYKCEMIKQ